MAAQPSKDNIVWYQLVNGQGNPYQNSDVFAVSLPSSMTFNFQLCQAIHAQNHHTLAGVDAPGLKVFLSLQDFHLGKPPLKASHLLTSFLTTTEDAPLCIVVPGIQVEEVPPTKRLPEEEHHHPRRKRWLAVNAALLEDKTKKPNNNVWITTPPASDDEDDDNKDAGIITMEDLKDVYDPIKSHYKLVSTPVPDETICTLLEYLTRLGKCLRFLFMAGDAGKLQLVAPILVQVCHLCEFTMETNVTMVGSKNLHFTGTFDFILSCRETAKQKRVCVVLAKRGNFRQGLAHTLLGCELMADMDDLDCAYGIVTDYVAWMFVKRLDDGIEVFGTVSLGIHHTTPTKESLADIVGYIYTMLRE